MAGTMSTVDLVMDLKRSLHDSAALFNAANDGDFVRFLDGALGPMQTKRPVTLMGTVQLVAGQARYPLAVYPDFVDYKSTLWAGGARACCALMPWEPGYPGPSPRVCGARESDGTAVLLFDPAPTVLHIAAHGSAFAFWYYARHRLAVDGGAPCSVAPADRRLLLLRAQVEALLELSVRNAGKPVQMRDGYSGTPRNSTPAALAAQLLQLFEDAR